MQTPYHLQNSQCIRCCSEEDQFSPFEGDKLERKLQREGIVHMLCFLQSTSTRLQKLPDFFSLVFLRSNIMRTPLHMESSEGHGDVLQRPLEVSEVHPRS